MDTGFPEYTDSFLLGQDILYTQFNDIEFYVEDFEQEHFYFNILKKLFTDLKLGKIFPLNGKNNVCNAARLNIGNKKKVYIVDLDFDQILDKVETINNLFYLKRYSIENYLITNDAIYEVIRMKNPKLKNNEIDKIFDFNVILAEACFCLKQLVCCFIVIQSKQLVYPYYSLDVNRDFDFTTTPPTYKLNFINDYFNKVEAKLKLKDRRYSLQSQTNKLLCHFRTISDGLSNIPGKYILVFFKERLQSFGLINQMKVETFTYILSKDFNSDELAYLRNNIENYIR